jgi:hypothetical protein
MLPGFSADASLYQSLASYVSRGGVISAVGGITPAAELPSFVGQQAAAASPHTAPLTAMRSCETWCIGSTLMCACPVHVPGLGTGIIVYACGTCINDPIFTA